MNGPRGIAALTLAAALAAAAAGCSSARLFSDFDEPEPPEVADAPWPRLVDTPDAPPAGSYNEAVPDPAVGVATVVDLTEAARASAAQAETLEPPVLTEAERRRLTGAR